MVEVYASIGRYMQLKVLSTMLAKRLEVSGVK